MPKLNIAEVCPVDSRNGDPRSFRVKCICGSLSFEASYEMTGDRCQGPSYAKFTCLDCGRTYRAKDDLKRQERKANATPR